MELIPINVRPSIKRSPKLSPPKKDINMLPMKRNPRVVSPILPPKAKNIKISMSSSSSESEEPVMKKTPKPRKNLKGKK